MADYILPLKSNSKKKGTWSFFIQGTVCIYASIPETEHTYLASTIIKGYLWLTRGFSILDMKADNQLAVAIVYRS